MCDGKNKTMYDELGKMKFDNIPSENQNTNKYEEEENSALSDDNGSKYREYERDWE